LEYKLYALNLLIDKHNQVSSITHSQRNQALAELRALLDLIEWLRKNSPDAL